MDDIAAPRTEAERAAFAAWAVGVLGDLMSRSRYADAVELGARTVAELERLAPDDVLARAEITAVTVHAIDRTGDTEAAERAGLATQLDLWEMWPGLVAAVDGPAAAATVEAVGRALAGADAGADDVDVWRLVRARRALGVVENNLGVVYQRVGDLTTAYRHLTRALALRDGRPEDRYLHSQTLGNLGGVALAAGDAGQAVELLERSAAVAEEIPEVLGFAGFVATLSALAHAHVVAGRPRAAEAVLRRAGDVARAQTPMSPRAVAGVDTRLAELLLECGCLGEARVLAEQAAARLAGDDDPAFAAQARWVLASARWGQGDVHGATRLFAAAARVQDAGLFRFLQMGDEDTRLRFAAGSRGAVDTLVSHALAARTADADRAAHATVLRRKSLATEIHFRRAAETRLPDLGPVLDGRSDTASLRSRISAALVSGGGVDEVGALVEQLRERERVLGFGERLLRDGTGRDGGAFTAWSERWLGAPESLPHALPECSVLVDYVRYLRTGPPPWDGTPADVRYAAFVVEPGTEHPRLVDLGPAGVIDALVTDLRRSLADDGELFATGRTPEYAGSRTEKLAETVRTTVLDPVLDLLPADPRTLLVSPDAALAAVPFGILPWDGGHLDDRFDVVFVETARDLLREPGPGPSGDPVVVADPDAGSPAGHWFGPLPGARAEGVEVAALLGVQPLVGAEATTARLAAVVRPSVLHVAGHGWYLPERAGDDDPPWAAHPRLRTLAGSDGARARGARSGLVLAGFTTGWFGGSLPDELGNGLLTADEVARLDLEGTELVVLSACDTAAGSAVALEGVLGLRRAFAQAGARSVLSTLWAVPDRPGKLLATAFHRQLLDGASRAEALTLAQQEVRRRYPHPYAWGAFVLHGEPGPLPDTLRRRLPAHPAAPVRRRRVDLALRRGDDRRALELLSDPVPRDAGSATLLGRLLAVAGRTDDAVAVLRPLADDGHAPAAVELAGIHRRAGRRDEAIAWLRRVVEGDGSAVHDLVDLLTDDGRGDDAQRVLRDAAERGDPRAMAAAGDAESLAGRSAEAEAWWRRAAEAGEPVAAAALARAAHRHGDVDQHDTWWLRAARNGHAAAAIDLGVVAHEQGRTADARALWTAGAEAGDATCAHNLGVLAWQLGHAGADTWWRRAAVRGQAGSANRLAEFAERCGLRTEAAIWWEHAARLGHDTAGVSLGLYLLDRGETDAAERWLRLAAESGQRPEAARGWGMLLRARGDTTCADWLRRAADAGDSAAATVLATDALQAGDADTAQVWVRRALENPVGDALALVGDWTAQGGDVATAVQWWTAAAQRGHERSAARTAACLMRDRAGADAGSATALFAAVPDPASEVTRRVVRLAGCGETALRDLAGRGHVHAHHDLALLADLRGDTAEAASHLAAAADAGDAAALLPAATFAAAAGQDGRRWLRRAAELGTAAAVARARASGLAATDRWWEQRAAEITDAERALAVAVDPSTAPDDAERHIRVAADLGLAEAVERLAATLVANGSPDAERWVEEAFWIGDFLRPNAWATDLFERGRTDDAELWWARCRRAARGR